MAKSSERVAGSQSASSDASSLMIDLEEQAIAIPTRGQIEQRAFELYLGRGCADGLDVQDWLQAESELFAETAQNAPRVKVLAA
ncbi:MAG TPA: DUF2934 domain-containing protein [Candidatus Acidoferrales bacterium]|nr:DUF2934 domain-containing protein [Candidatus Acidoferrales bacterium]